MAKVKTKAKSTKAERPIIYKDVKLDVLDGKAGRGWLTADDAKKLLGWRTEEEAGETFAEGDWVLKDRTGNKVQMVNNDHNRPLYQSNVEALCQEQLYQRWKFNGETIIITDTGRVGNGQHTLTALVLGQQDVEADPDKWSEKWPDGLKIAKAVIYGIEDDDSVMNTMDNGKPRSLTDVLFRSEHLKKVKPQLRKSLAAVLSFAIRVLWERTGAMRPGEAYDPRRTTGEMLDFLARHEKLVKAVQHVWAEDEHNALSKYVKAGTAGALMYLMASSDTDGAAYLKARRETKLKFTHWDKAEEFFTLLRDNKELKPIRDAIDGYKDPDTGEATITPQERTAIVIKGWRSFLANDSIKAKDLTLSYRTDDDTGERYLMEFPTVGGIDLGPKVNQAEDEEVEDETEALEEELDAELAAMGDSDYTATEEVEEIIEERAEEEGPKKEKPKKAKKKAKAGSDE